VAGVYPGVNIHATNEQYLKRVNIMDNEKITLLIVTLAAAACFFLLLLLVSKANAHDWYDNECCSERDCAPVTNSLRLPNGDLKVTTKQGTGIVSKNTNRKASKDSEEHACMLPNSERVICFYQPLNF
jgi:hypothetical protein